MRRINRKGRFIEGNVIEHLIGHYYYPSWKGILAVLIIVMASCWAAVRRKDLDKAQKCVFPVLILYLCAVFSVTIVNRFPYDEVRYNLELFWSYQKASERSYYLLEILLNYFLLLPYGVLMSFYIKRRYVFLSGILLSIGIETVQLFMKRGLFETDDILGNTIGVVLGTLIYTAIRKKGYGPDGRVS